MELIPWVEPANLSVEPLLFRLRIAQSSTAMNQFHLIACAAAAFATTCGAAVTKLPAEDRKALSRDREKVRMILSMKEIPGPVVDACAAVMDGHKFILANPGEPFQVTDTIIDRDLPGRRLIWVASLPGYHVVHYESGGIAHIYHILLVATGNAPKAAKVIWSAIINAPLKTYDDFLAALNAQKLDDTATYSH
jgi:hypothetical protein